MGRFFLISCHGMQKKWPPSGPRPRGYRKFCFAVPWILFMFVNTNTKRHMGLPQYFNQLNFIVCHNSLLLSDKLTFNTGDRSSIDRSTCGAFIPKSNYNEFYFCDQVLSFFLEQPHNHSSSLDILWLYVLPKI